MQETTNENVRAFPDALDGTPGGELDQDNAPEANTAPANEEELTREQQLLSQDQEELMKLCRDSIDSVKQQEAERKAINDKITEIRSTLETKGITKKAFAAALVVSKLRDDEMDGYDLAMTMLRTAMGRPIEVSQMDLFGSEADDAA